MECMQSIKSNLEIRYLGRYYQDKLKLNLFKALVESILLYNATTWTITKTLAKQLDGT
jgi:hypothetical protein